MWYTPNHVCCVSFKKNNNILTENLKTLKILPFTDYMQKCDQKSEKFGWIRTRREWRKKAIPIRFIEVNVKIISHLKRVLLLLMRSEYASYQLKHVELSFSTYILPYWSKWIGFNWWGFSVAETNPEFQSGFLRSVICKFEFLTS